MDADPTAWALADEERVLQIGRALAGNALMHTPSGTEVRISASRRERARRAHGRATTARASRHEHAERIFDRFYRVEGPQASGSGLGLAIARELAERMDGSVELVSRPGSTRFTLSLPRVPAAVST